MRARQLELYVENVFTFALVWSIGAVVNDASRPKFDAFLRALARGTPPAGYDVAQGAQVRPWILWMPEGEGTCFDYVFVPTSGKWELWDTSVPTIDPLPPLHIADGDSRVLVPTTDTIRYTRLLDTLVKAGTPLLLVGDTGTGKTRMVEAWLQQLPARAWSPPVTVTFSSQTSPDQVRMPRLERSVVTLVAGRSLPALYPCVAVA
jgi:dynein heavy chain, axonemal